MKVSYIANVRFPTEKAHGIQIMQMMHAFATSKGGGGVTGAELIVPRRFNKVHADPFEYYEVDKSFKIMKLPCIDLIPFHAGTFGFLVQTITFLISAKIYLWFRRYGMLYTREPLTGLFFSGHVLELHSIPKKIIGFHKIIWKKAKKIIVLTSFIKNGLIRAGVGSDNILVAPDGVDLKKFNRDISQEEARRRLHVPPHKKIIGYVGMLRTMGMEKGIDVAIKSSAFLPDDYMLMLVGGNKDDIDFYKSLAKSEHAEHKVLFIGKVPHSDIPIYLKASDVLIAPFPENEHYQFYMSPLKIFEYMASQRPIITSDLPSLREVLSEKNALLIKPGDSRELAEAIKQVSQNQMFAGDISKQALEDVKNYTWERRADNILNFIP